MSSNTHGVQSRDSRIGTPNLLNIFWGAFANGFRRLSGWRKRGVLGKALAEQRRRMRFEALEPRLLLSADLSYTAAASGDLTLRVGAVDGVETLQLVDSADASIVFASEALANIDGSSGYGARIDAGGFDVALRIDTSAEAAGIAGGIVFAGGDGNSTLAGADLDNTWTLAGEGSGGVGSVTFSGVEQLVGGAGSDTLVGTAQDTTWSITGAGSGEVDGVLFEAIESLLGTGGNEDRFVVGALGSLSGVMDGGAGGFDSLVLDGGSFGSVAYTATGPNSGTINRDGVLLTYDGLEPIEDLTAVASLTITASDFDDVATLTDNGSTLTLTSVSGTFESITFAQPTTTLTINLGSG